MIVPTLNSSIAFPRVILTAPVTFYLTWWLFGRKGKHQKKKRKRKFVTVLLLLHALDFWLQGHGILAP